MAVPATEDRWLPEWVGAAYADNTGHHRRFDEWFLADLPLGPTSSVLDVGCGSGDFTRVVADRVAAGHVVGLDAAPSMVDEARGRAGANQSFVVAPAQELAAALAGSGEDRHAPFDVVFSRSTLHWVPADDHPGVLAQARELLAPDGWLRIECGGGDNVRGVVSVLDPISVSYDGPTTPWTFFGAGAYLPLLQATGFDVEPERGCYVRTTAQHRPFDRRSFRGWLTSQCLAAYTNAMPAEHHEAFTAEVLDRLDDFARPDGSFDQVFVRLDVRVRRA